VGDEEGCRDLITTSLSNPRCVTPVPERHCLFITPGICRLCKIMRHPTLSLKENEMKLEF
jgi:hypothetical protein